VSNFWSQLRHSDFLSIRRGDRKMFFPQKKKLIIIKEKLPVAVPFSLGTCKETVERDKRISKWITGRQRL
jgi:hypothetical protein